MAGVAVPRGFFRRAMESSMIGLVTPLSEPCVKSGQREGKREKGKKLHSESFEESFNFAFSFRAIRGAVKERDAEGGGGVSELVRTEGGGIVEIDPSGESPFAQRLNQAVGQVLEVFLQIEFPMGNESGVVIQEGLEKTFANFSIGDHRGPMHTVGLPEIVGKFGFISSAIGFQGLRLVEPASLEEPIEALNRGLKVGREKLSFPGHPENDRQGGPLEFCF